MSLTHEAVDVRVSKRILWFGNEAYPLPNITRTNTRMLTPDRGAAIRKFVISAAVWMFVGAVVVGVAPGVLTTLVYLGVLGWQVYRLVKLVEFLKLTLFELVIETASGSHRGLVSPDGAVVTDLSLRITDAINNPDAEFRMQLQHFHVGGDYVKVNGTGNIGKVVR